MTMTATQPDRTLAELASLGSRIFEQTVRPTLQTDDHGKYVAIDVESGEFELDADDYSAVMRLRSCKPTANIWLMRAGSPTTCRIGVRQSGVSQ
jgi:hypothetical protein